MKRFIILFIILFSVPESTWAQYPAKFDSLKVYTSQYYGTGLHLNQYDIMYSGDSVLITDSKTIQQLHNNLMSIKANISFDSLNKIRGEFNAETMNVRCVFIFYQGRKTNLVGISPQRLMFIDNLVFRKKSVRLEKIIKEPKVLYRNLFPNKEDVINKIRGK